MYENTHTDLKYHTVTESNQRWVLVNILKWYKLIITPPLMIIVCSEIPQRISLRTMFPKDVVDYLLSKNLTFISSRTSVQDLTLRESSVENLMLLTFKPITCLTLLNEIRLTTLARREALKTLKPKICFCLILSWQ